MCQLGGSCHRLISLAPGDKTTTRLLDGNVPLRPARSTQRFCYLGGAMEDLPENLVLRQATNGCGAESSKSGWPDLNRRPLGPEPSALNQAELHPVGQGQRS